MAASSAQVLSPSAGWAVVIALGIGFAFLMLGITLIQERYTSVSIKTNEEFSSASRSVKTGLIAAGIVSAWTWAATLLQSSTVAFKYGVSGPYWYAAGATVQVLLFSMMSSKTKANAPYAHTFLEIIRRRWGTVAHICFLFFALATNILVGAMLILGGSATVNQLTGMPTLAAIFLTPISVAIYALIGGMRSTLLADYAHTTVLVCLIFTFAFTVYATSDKIGSPQAMYDLLLAAEPVPGNARGSYLTMRSLDGLKFGIINVLTIKLVAASEISKARRSLRKAAFIVTRGIASNPATASKAFILGGIAWFAVPMLTASSLGLAARALYGKDPAMALLSDSEISAGLAAPAAAAALLGKSGAAAMLILLYLAVTSATSAQLIAVSSVVTFDIWKPYINPRASEKQLFLVSHISVAGWSIVMGLLGLAFYYAGISLGWIYVMMGILVAPAVFPVFACIVWSKANRTGAVVGMFTGLALGITAWLVSAKKLEGELTITSTNADNPLLAGNLISIGVPTVITIVTSLIWPEKYSFEGTRAIHAPDEIDQTKKAIQHASGETSSSDPSTPTDEKKDLSAASPKAAAIAADSNAESGAWHQSHEYRHVRAAGLDPADLAKSFQKSVRLSIPLAFILIIFVPCMAIIAKTFSPAGLGAWIGICIFWLFCSSFIVVLLPLWESRVALGEIARGIAADLTGRRRQTSS